MSSNWTKNIFLFWKLNIQALIFEYFNSSRKEKKAYKTITQLPLTQRSLLQKHLLPGIWYLYCSFLSPLLQMTNVGGHKLTHATLSPPEHVHDAVQLLSIKLCPTWYSFPFALQVAKREFLPKKCNHSSLSNKIVF